MLPDDASAEFHDFFERHYAELARFAHLLTGEADAADGLAADALISMGQRWDRVRTAEHATGVRDASGDSYRVDARTSGASPVGLGRLHSDPLRVDHGVRRRGPRSGLVGCGSS